MDHISTGTTHSGSWAATSRPPVMENGRRFRIRLGGLGRFLRRLQEPSSRFDRCAGQAQEACTFVGWRQTRIPWLFHNGGHKCTVHVLYRREGSTWAYDLTAVSCASDAVVSRSSGSGPITNFYPILQVTWSCCSRCWELGVYIHSSTTLHS